MKFLIANQKFLILKFLLASLMIYDDTQFANSLARVEIVFTLVGIEAITYGQPSPPKIQECQMA